MLLLSIEKSILFQMDGKRLFVEQANSITIKMTLNEHTHNIIYYSAVENLRNCGQISV